ncbi:TPA: hypothetical protein ACMDXT_000028 [Vibrio parahaemolyticus]
MDVKQLSSHPKLKMALSPFYRKEFSEAISASISKSHDATMNIYSLFIQVVVNKGITSGYTPLDIFDNEEALNSHFRCLIGFINSEVLALNIKTRYTYGNNFRKIFNQLAANKNLQLHKIRISTVNISGDVEQCHREYLSLSPCETLLLSFSGWEAHDKQGKVYYVHLAAFNDKYGDDITTTFHKAIANYTKTQKPITAQGILERIQLLINTFVDICHSKGELMFHLHPKRCHLFFERILNILFMNIVINQYDLKSFFSNWKSTVNYFSACFFDTGVLSRPIKEILTPEFKEPEESPYAFSSGGKLSNKEVDRWLVDIPLHVTDDETLNIIHKRLNDDLEHVKIINHLSFVNIKKQQEFVNANRTKGKIKKLPINGVSQYKGNRYVFPIGEEHPENTIHNFYHHGFSKDCFGNGSSTYPNFLGYAKKGNQLVQLLNLPTRSSHNTLITLLILEHPKITPSWLTKWELYDKSGNMIGFKQTGKLWIAVSYKDRRGSSTSQQEVILNEYTKSIVELIIEQTKYSREVLKSKGDPRWRYMLLTANVQQPSYNKSLMANICDREGDYLIKPSYRRITQMVPLRSEGQSFKTIYKIHGNVLNEVLNKEEARKLSEVVTPRSIRKARGLQIYLETRSLSAVAEALGHKEVNVDLLASYLPKPLMDYFNDRWVRQFQNAIIYESLKDSKYLNDALDFNPNELDEFLSNHGLGDLPENLDKAKSCAVNESHQKDIESIDEIVYTLSVPLLQVLVAIKSSLDEKIIMIEQNALLERWHEAACFILTSIEQKYRSNKDLIEIYKTALNHPLDPKVFVERLCH